MRRASLIILTVAIVSSTVIATSPLPTSTTTDSPTKFEFKRHHRGPIHSIPSKSNSSKVIKLRDTAPTPVFTPPPGTYEASPGDYPQIDGSDGTANNLTLMSAFKYGSTFFPLAMLAVVSSGILVCFFLIALGKACAHRKKFADPLDYEDGMPEVKKEPLPIVNVAAPEARRDWEWDQKVDDSKKDNYENQNKSTTRLVDEPIGGERVLSISSKSNVGEYGMPQVPARSHRDVGAQNARNINSSNNNKSRHLTSTTTASNTTSAHPLSHHQTIGSSSDQASQRSSSYSRSRSSSVDSYDEFSPPSPRSPNNDPPSPRSPNSYNNSSTQQPPRSILSNGGVQITQPRPLFINPVSSPTKSNLNGLGSPNNKLPSPGSKAGSPTFMSHLQNTKPLDYSSIPPSPTTPFSSNSAAPELLPHLRFAPIALDAPPKKNKRFSAISTPLSNRFSLASSNWSFQAPPTPTLPPGPIEQSIMNEQQARQFQQEQYDQQDFNSRAEGNGGELPYHLGPSDSTLDYPPKSPHSNLASPKALAYVERPRTDSIGGFSSVTNGTGGGRKSKRDVVSGVYSGYTPSNFAPSIKSPKFAGKK